MRKIIVILLSALLIGCCTSCGHKEADQYQVIYEIDIKYNDGLHKLLVGKMVVGCKPGVTPILDWEYNTSSFKDALTINGHYYSTGWNTSVNAIANNVAEYTVQKFEFIKIYDAVTRNESKEILKNLKAEIDNIKPKTETETDEVDEEQEQVEKEEKSDSGWDW